MNIGTVKWFDRQLGYGYIQPADGSPQIFVHFTALDLAGLKTLAKGQTLRFEITQEGGVSRATRLAEAQAA